MQFRTCKLLWLACVCVGQRCAGSSQFGAKMVSTTIINLNNNISYLIIGNTKVN